LGEVTVGFTVGFVANLIFLVFQVAGSIIGNQMGFGIIQLFDPVRQQRSTVVDEFYSVVATLIFLLLDGHHMLIRAIDRTYQAVPSGAIVHPQLIALPLGRLTSEVFVGALQLALPVLAALLLTDLALALTSRAVPQVNVFFLGLPLKVLVGMLALSFALPATISFMRDQMDLGARNILTMVGSL
jgi:flagellar biosynthetic protein FliR